MARHPEATPETPRGARVLALAVLAWAVWLFLGSVQNTVGPDYGMNIAFRWIRTVHQNPERSILGIWLLLLASRRSPQLPPRQASD
jgi:hypothetical protein